MTKQETLQNYFTLSDIELVVFINANIFEPTDLNGIFSYYTYNNKTEVTQALLAKSNPTQEELNFCFSGGILNNTIIDLLLPLKPSAETLGNYIFRICSNFQMHNETLEGITPFSDTEKKGNLATVEKLMKAGAIIQPHQCYDVALVCFAVNNIDLFETYFDKPEALRWHLQFCCRKGNEKLKEYVLAKNIDYKSEDGIALLSGSMCDDRKLFFNTLPLVPDLNLIIDSNRSLLDEAIDYDDLEIIKALIDKGGKPLFNGKNVLLYAMNSKDENLAKLLLDSFDIDIHMNNNECLVNACKFQKVDIAKLLLERGADVHAQKNACLKIATKNKQQALIDLLKKFDANEIDIAPYKFNCDVATADFETLWKEWIIYYKKNFPNAIESASNLINPILITAPASDIKECELGYGTAFNDELKIVYKHCTQGQYLFFGMCLMSPADVASNLKNWTDLAVNGQLNNIQNYPVYPEGTIKNEYINTKWLSFANDLTTNYISIDYDPAAKGTVGQIINSGRDQWERFVVAKNITELARKVMHIVEANNVEISPEGYFNLKSEGGGGFLYDVLALIKEGRW
jgi:cell wall assembly regulator SMI1/ankyrin repeat protein